MRFETWDVFTDRPFAGNPLAIVWPEPGEAPPMQAVAREFNLSETVFVLPPQAGGTARLRIFTPGQELPFAGHPTIGTAVALAGRGPDLVLELGVGPLPVRAEAGRARLTTRVPFAREFDVASETVAPCIGLEPGAIRTGTHPPVRAGVGLPFVLTEVEPDALDACAPDVDAFRRAEALHDAPFHFDVLAYARDGDAVRARMFAPLDGIPEDPATGSAACALAALLREVLGRPVALDMRQGEAMGRPSRIAVEADAEGAVHLEGAAVKVMEGRLCTS